jgi:hypothetical protein
MKQTRPLSNEPGAVQLVDFVAREAFRKGLTWTRGPVRPILRKSTFAGPSQAVRPGRVHPATSDAFITDLPCRLRRPLARL